MSKHLVIAGGGVGALEALLALPSLTLDAHRIDVLTAGRYVTVSVAEPLNADPAPRYEWRVIARDRGVRPDAREIDTRDGTVAV